MGGRIRAPGAFLFALVCLVSFSACRGCEDRLPTTPEEVNTDPCRNARCAEGEVCDRGVCIPAASAGGGNQSTVTCNRTTPDGQCVASRDVCQNGVCIKDGDALPPCAAGVNGFCADRAACVNGVCTAITDATECAPANPSGLCPGGESCVLGLCFEDDGTLFCDAAHPGGYCVGQQVCTGGTCMPITPTCTPALPTGTCPAWQQCVQGSCVGPQPPDACTPQNLAGRCPAEQVCVAGTCTLITDANDCDSEHPNGLCPTGSSCQNGSCITITTDNLCSPTNTSGLCPNGQICAGGSCVPTACENGGAACPQDRACENFVCVLQPCDATHPTGTCANPALTCDRGACVPPTCKPTVPNGSCPTGQFCDNGACAPITCSAVLPAGTCPTGQRCIGGECQLSGCRDQMDPDAFCAPNVCDSVLDVCLRPPCGLTPPNDPMGRCTVLGEACINGVCQVPACGPMYPGGSCPTGQKCSTTPSGVACVDLPCTFANQDGPCTQAGRICCNPTRQYVSGPSGPTGEEQRSCINGLFGQCVIKNCGPGTTEMDLTSQQGTCPVGQTCQDLGAGNWGCQAVQCDATHTSSPCPLFMSAAADLCVDGNCVPICDDAAGPRGNEHLTGACPGGFVCVNTQCAPPCQGVASIHRGMCPAGFDICDRDSDCDGYSDWDEGAEDDNTPAQPRQFPNDGALDGDSTDFDGDGIPDALDVDSDNDGLLDRVETFAGRTNRDSDGDGISDGVEARVSGAVASDPVSAPINSDNDVLPDYLDTDSDNDGISDACESRAGSNANCYTAGAIIDFTGPGGTPLPALVDTDADGQPDFRDVDSDADGVSDSIEARPKPWLAANVTGNTVDPMAPADHGGAAVADYRDTDSDGDGVNDEDEDKDGDGIVDCLMNGATPVPDNRPAPPAATCAFFFDAASSSYWNPGCPAQKCYFAETSRITSETDGDGTGDQQDGLFLVCSAANLKPINVFASQPADYLLALEQSFNQNRQLQRAGDLVGMLINDNRYEADAVQIATKTGSNAVAGFILQRTPATAAIGADNMNANATQKLINKAVAQEAIDRAAWQAASGGTQLDLVGNGFTLILTRNFASYDNFGVVQSRYRVRTNTARRTSVMRDRVMKVLDNTLVGYPAESVYSDDLEGGRSSNDFILIVETLYRFDNGNTTSPQGSVLVVGAIVPIGDSNTERTYNYRPQCNVTSNANCNTRDGCALTPANTSTGFDAAGPFDDCVDRATYCAGFASPNTPSMGLGCTAANTSERCTWDALNGVCKEVVPYQIPLFFADNITDGSAVTQYGDGLATACETFTQKISKFDFLWTIDDSGSMSQEIAQVRAGAAAFAQLVDTSEADYRLASVATDHSIGGWEPSFGNARANVVGDDGSLPRDWSNSSTTNHFTGKVQGLCGVSGATGNRSVDAGCDAVGYFQDRLPPDTDGSGAEFSMFASMWQLHRAGTSDHCTGAAQNACEAMPECAWLATPGVCIESRCDVGTNAVECDGRSTCQQANNHPGGAQTICGQLPGCEWQASANDCVTSICRSNTTSGTCGATAGCTWTGVYCNDVNTPPEDRAEPTGCEWSIGHNRCMPRIPFPCRGLSQTDCDDYSTLCSWNGGQNRCDAGNASTRGCYWVPAANCNDTEAPGCELNGSMCQPKTGVRSSMCGAVMDKTTCDRFGGSTANGACVWTGSACTPSAFRSIRDEAEVGRVLVVVTDEEECYNKDSNTDGGCEWLDYNNGLLDYSPATAGGARRAARTQNYLRFLQARGFTVFAITGDKADESLPSGPGNGGCNDNGNQADPNNTIIDISEATGGAWGTICPSDLYPTIEAIVLQVLGQSSPYVLSGPGQPISATIKVAVETCVTPGTYPYCDGAGTEMKVVPRSRENGFDYNATFNSIVLYGNARPKNNGDVVVSYRYWVDQTPDTNGSCPCAQGNPAQSCACPPGEVCAINNFDFCLAASAGQCPTRSTLGNCELNGGRCESKCLNTTVEAACEAIVGCAWNEALSRCEIDYCAEAPTPGECAEVAGCQWNTSIPRCVPTGACDTDPTCGGCPNGGTCDPNSGLCCCTAPCDGGCPSGQTCSNAPAAGTCVDPLTPGACGTCECPDCPGPMDPPCPAGTYCDPTTCGACLCDQTCAHCSGPGCTPGVGCTGTYTCSQGGPTCGQCIPPSCDTVPCPFGQQCVGGVCVCDTSCGGATPPCPQGSECDTDPASQTCGQCFCDDQCGQGKACANDNECGPNQQCVGNVCTGCLNGTICDTDATSCKCGSCRFPPTCTPSSCPPGQVCDKCVGSCVIDPTCGGCPVGSTCDTTTGICISTQCPPSVAPGTIPVPDRPTSPYCQPANLNCCLGPEGVSPYDNDLDGFMSCSSGCGSTFEACGGDPCDADDNDPNVHP